MIRNATYFYLFFVIGVSGGHACQPRNMIMYLPDSLPGVEGTLEGFIANPKPEKFLQDVYVQPSYHDGDEMFI